MKKAIYLGAMAALLLGACNDTDVDMGQWRPGDASNAPGVYFSGNEDLSTLIVGEETVLKLNVARLGDEGDLTVPVVVKQKHDAMEVATEIHFADGMSHTTLDVDCSKLPTRTQFDLEVTFPEQYINPYTAGSPVYQGKVLVSDWTEVPGSPITFDFRDTSFNPYTDLQDVQSRMYQLDGTDRFRIDNFLNSDLDFTFELVESPYANQKGMFRIMPITNQLTLNDYGWGESSYYNSWWFFDSSDPDNGWPVYDLFDRNGNPTSIYGLTFMWYDEDSSREYCYVRRQGTPNASGSKASYNYAYMFVYGYSDEEWENYTPYFYVHFSWYNPE